ncbi:ABC transporter B family member 15-like [Dorcoceras hygrometricum]|uniref:ABC transporter B family member 15-like n=1 Tax=Dorcoceras hygrometricum TaxID=472368 RepID=A0A2Z7B807_9LAMI|nr:ABC transporter B family member 15-like [Dorcoceras hygrometricum]
MGCYAGSVGVQSVGSIKLVHQLDEIKEHIDSSAEDEVQNGSSADQVQRTSAVFKCRCIHKCSDQVQKRPAEYDEQGGSKQLKTRKEQNKSSSRADKKRALNENREEKSSDQLSVMKKSEWSKAGQGQTNSGSISADAMSWCTEPSWLRSN